MFKPVIVVTGASKGLGLAVTKLLLQKFGVCVVAISRTESPGLQELAQAHGQALLHYKCDVTDSVNFEKAVTDAHAKFDRIDGVVLNAGVFEPIGKITNPAVSLDEWKTSFDVNFFSLVSALRVVVPLLHNNGTDPKGRVIFVSSGAAIGGTHGWAPYNASKAAMNSLCRTLAMEEPDIVCVAVRPGKVDTAMQAQIRGLTGTDKMRPEDVAEFVKSYEEGELIHPEESGHVIASMALNANREFSGQFISWNSEECRDFWDTK
ncbi:short-chain dehydrogenase [Trametopsis cervina]|nr:short-chain dehydrogenase [Trametopsis cervina]